MLDKVVYTSNVAALAAAMEALAERSPSQPGVVLVYGDTGFGKTIGTRHLAVRDRAIFLDEADCIVDKQELVEMLRILHDLTAVALVIAGMAEFRKKLYRRPQLARRIQHEIQR